MSGLVTLEDHEALWQKIQARRCEREQERLAPVLTRLWDGDYRLRGQVAGERAGSFEFIENDVGTAFLELPLNHYLAAWIMNHRGRAKRNVHVTFDKQGARWGGRMSSYRVVRTENGDAYLEVNFVHDYEQAKHILCWSNPFLRPELQFPKMWIIFGPAKWCLLMTLFVNILRLETSLWTLPDNPLDPSEWFPLSLNISNWRNIVKPFPFLGDNSNLTIIFSRFKPFFDVAKDVLADAQLTMTCRRYLHGEDPHPFEDLRGELNIGPLEDLLSLIPIRHGCLVWDIVDNSGWGTETAFGGSLLTGLIRAVVNIAADGTTENIDVFHQDPVFPNQYYRPGWRGTLPNAPHVVFLDGKYTGIKSSEYEYVEATSTSFVGGGHSMPGINEAISAAINIGGDFLTSFINSQIAAIPAVAALGGAIDIPPLGGMIDAVAKIFYEDVFMAFQETPTLRAAGLSLPIAGLEDIVTGLGDFHLYEEWVDGFDKAFTLSAAAAVRAAIFKTRARINHKIKVSDASPYYIGERGYGHFWLGDRVGRTIQDHPDPDLIFVERVHRIKYEWDKDGPKGWDISIGHREPRDPLLALYEKVRDLGSNVSQLGVI
ncbi:minor tail protein [Mycobacterium phage SydNat]|uniref:Minor tail protein n=1 Tax=Mycobacterium phage Zolita TaxID=2593355 RepID=A0A514U2C2_9CAUD|nr:minor tail protein [Mycobacterium phage Zolita]QDK03108.1 minor tail protein [Mycobacterium phage Zolita]UVK64244.1 minor tail protein [Mycobacterium phage SydNat]UVK64330.1 minor tail protein [Mycobacterium phage Ghoulboy]